MKWDQLKRNWPSVCEDIKHKWGKFTVEDLAMIAGQRESFVRLFEQRYGDDQVAAGVKVDAFVEGLKARPELKKLNSWPQRCWTNLRSYIHVPSRR
jgi:uncharacterized protein YjbJ (UPF0337 family)